MAPLFTLFFLYVNIIYFNQWNEFPTLLLWMNFLHALIVHSAYRNAWLSFLNRLSSSEAKLQMWYKRSVRQSTDVFKRAVFCLIARCDLNDCHPQVIAKTEDYMWLKVSWTYSCVCVMLQLYQQCFIQYYHAMSVMSGSVGPTWSY